MKPGDRVWVFDALIQLIREIEVDKVVYEDGCEILYAKHTLVDYMFGYDAFESREALCEHYRKIFE